MQTFDETRSLVASGQHPAWQKAVRMFLAGKGGKTIHQIAETYILAAEEVEDGWRIGVVQPQLGRERPYEQISQFYRRTQSSPPEEPQISMFPLGLLFIGAAKNGQGADDEVLIHHDILAAFVGRPTEEVQSLVCDRAFAFAAVRLREMTGKDIPSVMSAVEVDTGRLLAFVTIPRSGQVH